MTDLPNDRNADAQGNDLDIERRGFMKGAAAVGLLGTIGIAAGGVAQRAEGSQQSAGEDLQPPPGLGPHGEVDSRFPVTFRASVPESLNIMSQYFLALSQRNLDGMAQLMHFPFATHEGPDAILVESPESLLANPPLSMNVTGKGDSKIKAGAFDILDSIQLHIYGPVGAGLSLQYSRFEPNGNKILECHGLYAVTNNDGKWGIEWASTIFKPANQVGRDEWYNYPIINYALHENHRDHVMARKYGDLVELRKTVYDPYPHASVSISGLHVKGVKSRLRFSSGDTMQESDKQDYNEATFADRAGGGLGKWALSIETPDTRMIYASAEKGHFQSGFYRYTIDGTVISDQRYIGALVNRRGAWYGNDISRTIGGMSYLHHINDVRS